MTFENNEFHLTTEELHNLLCDCGIKQIVAPLNSPYVLEFIRMLKTYFPKECEKLKENIKAITQEEMWEGGAK